MSHHSHALICDDLQRKILKGVNAISARKYSTPDLAARSRQILSSVAEQVSTARKTLRAGRKRVRLVYSLLCSDDWLAQTKLNIKRITDMLMQGMNDVDSDSE